MIEPGESELDAAKRETLEETGLAARVPVRRRAPGHPPLRRRQGRALLPRPDGEKRCRAAVSPELGHPEHHEWRWVSFDEAEELLPPRLGVVLDWARRQLA